MIHPTAIISPEVEMGEDVQVGPYSIIKGKVKIGRGTCIESHVCIGMGVGGITIGQNNTAIISPEVEMGEDVQVGPYSIINGKVKIGRGTRMESHVCIGMGVGEITIGQNNHFFQGSMTGGFPQHLDYQRENTCLVIGNKNIIREGSTIHMGTPQGEGVTRVGDNNLLMAYTHIGHDCQLGDHIVLSNSSNLGGHVQIGDRAILSGNVLCAPFVKLGRLCYITGASCVNKDVLPFSIADGRFALMRAANKVGLKRANFPRDEMQSVHQAIRYIIKGARTITEALEKINKHCSPSESIYDIINFTKNSKKGLAR